MDTEQPPDAPTEIARLTAEVAAERHLLNGLDDAIGVMYATRKTAVNRMFDTQSKLATLKHYTALAAEAQAQ